MTLPAAPSLRFGPLTISDFVRYAGASGDFNPLHHDPEFAKAAGLPGVMAHGMLSAGLLGSFVTHWFGPGCVRRYKIRFTDRVWPGDILLPRGEIVRVLERDGLRLAELTLVLDRQSGSAVVTGSALVAILAEDAS